MLTQLAKGKRMAACTPVLAVLVCCGLAKRRPSGHPRHSQGGNTGRHRKKIRCHCLRPSFPQRHLQPEPVKVGQKINIPAKSVSVTYTVRAGDTLSGIAKKHNTTTSAIARATGISDPRKLRPGQKLKSPRADQAANPPSRNRPTSRRIRCPRSTAPIRRGRWKHIVIHHSGDNTNSIQGMEHYHRRVRRMENGLAYHFVIGNGVNTGDGKIYVGDRWRRQIRGGHVASTALNEIAIGICLVGNFDQRVPTSRQRSSLKALVARLRARTGIPYKEVRTHRHINPKPTACPGRRFDLRSILNS